MRAFKIAVAALFVAAALAPGIGADREHILGAETQREHILSADVETMREHIL
jgi:hypothetical protein